MLEITRLWKNKSKDGTKTFLSGSWGNTRMVIFPNAYKDQDNQPDFVVYLEEAKKKEAVSGVAESNDNPFDDVA